MGELGKTNVASSGTNSTWPPDKQEHPESGRNTNLGQNADLGQNSGLGQNKNKEINVCFKVLILLCVAKKYDN